MPKQLLAIAPALLEIGGRTYTVESGASFAVSEDEANLILTGFSATKFKVITEIEVMPEPISIHSAGLSYHTPPTSKVPILTKHQDWVTPAAAGTVPDPLIDAYAEYAKDGEAFFPAVSSAPNLEQVGPMEAEISETHERIQITPDTHWSKVKAQLALIERESPINTQLVEEIKTMFPKSATIQAECNRILSL